MKNSKIPNIWGTWVTLISYFSIHLPPPCFSLSPTEQLLSLSLHSFCTVSLMWHFQKPSLKLLSHRMVPIKSVVHLYFILCKKPLNLSTFFSALVHLLKVSRSGLNQVPFKCLLGHCKMEAGRNRKKAKKIPKSICFIPFIGFFFSFCNSNIYLHTVLEIFLMAPITWGL